MRILILNQHVSHICVILNRFTAQILAVLWFHMCVCLSKNPQKVTCCNILLDCLKLEDHFNKLMQCYSIYFHLELIYPNLVALKKNENHILWPTCSTIMAHQGAAAHTLRISIDKPSCNPEEVRNQIHSVLVY